MRKVTQVLVASMLLGLAGTQGAQAELAAKGLPHPNNGFPTWFKDSHGVTLQLCIEAGNPMCIFDPVVTGNSFSEQIGFGAEAFWWMASSAVDVTGGRAELVLALEAAFGQEVPKEDDQFAFGRVRIRVDAPVDGVYKIWHPYLAAPACLPEEYTVTAGRRAINVTRDFGGGAPFADMLGGEIGPFLVWDPAVEPLAPTGYAGDPTVAHAVVGSPCGINFFKVEGPQAANLGGPQGSENVVESHDFSVMGKIYDNVTTPAPVVIDHATFYRNAAGTSARINVWAQSDPAANLTRSGQPGTAQAMEKDWEGNFFNRRAYSNSNASRLQPTVTVTAVNPGDLITTQDSALIDSIKITNAVFAPTTKTLKVVAETSDLYRPAAINPNDPINGHARRLYARCGTRVAEMVADTAVAGRFSVTFDNVIVPPSSVMVMSDLGGSDSEAVVP